MSLLGQTRKFFSSAWNCKYRISLNIDFQTSPPSSSFSAQLTYQYPAKKIFSLSTRPTTSDTFLQKVSHKCIHVPFDQGADIENKCCPIRLIFSGFVVHVKGYKTVVKRSLNSTSWLSTGWPKLAVFRGPVKGVFCSISRFPTCKPQFSTFFNI